MYYSEGAIVRDIYGSMTPSTTMIPLNPAAEVRHAAVMAALPPEDMPSIDHLVSAAMEMKPEDNEDPRLFAEYQGRILQRALEKKFAAEGRIPSDDPRQPAPYKRPVRANDPNIPIMQNTRIRSLAATERPIGGPPASALPQRHALTQKVR